MLNRKPLQLILYTVGVVLVIATSLFLMWLLALVTIGIFFYRLERVQLQPEGGFASLIYTYVGSLFLAPLGLIPAYFLSMRVAVWLREKQGWELRHPRRLFLVALGVPILIFLLLMQLAR